MKFWPLTNKCLGNSKMPVVCNYSTAPQFYTPSNIACLAPAHGRLGGAGRVVRVHDGFWHCCLYLKHIKRMPFVTPNSPFFDTGVSILYLICYMISVIFKFGCSKVFNYDVDPTSGKHTKNTPKNTSLILAHMILRMFRNIGEKELAAPSCPPAVQRHICERPGGRQAGTDGRGGQPTRRRAGHLGPIRCDTARDPDTTS